MWTACGLVQAAGIGSYCRHGGMFTPSRGSVFRRRPLANRGGTHEKIPDPASHACHLHGGSRSDAGSRTRQGQCQGAEDDRASQEAQGRASARWLAERRFWSSPIRGLACCRSVSSAGRGMPGQRAKLRLQDLAAAVRRRSRSKNVRDRWRLSDPDRVIAPFADGLARSACSGDMSLRRSLTASLARPARAT